MSTEDTLEQIKLLSPKDGDFVIFKSKMNHHNEFTQMWRQVKAHFPDIRLLALQINVDEDE